MHDIASCLCITQAMKTMQYNSGEVPHAKAFSLRKFEKSVFKKVDFIRMF